MRVLVMAMIGWKTKPVQPGGTKVLWVATEQAVRGEADRLPAACSVAVAPLRRIGDRPVRSNGIQAIYVIGEPGLSVRVLGALPALNMDQEGVVAGPGHISTAWRCTPDVHNCFMITPPAW